MMGNLNPNQKNGAIVVVVLAMGVVCTKAIGVLSGNGNPDQGHNNFKC